MKWFKHDANSSLDAKLQRLRLKYGMEGYGLYWYLLECIARNVEQHNLTFELEEDAELIAAATGIFHERVEEMMLYMINLKLFENCEGRVTCLKMATRTDEYTQKLLRNPDRLQTVSGHTPDKVPPIRIEEKRREEKEKTAVKFDQLSSMWPKGLGSKGSVADARKCFEKLSPDDDLFAKMCDALNRQAEHKQSLKDAGEFFENFQHLQRWISKRRWEDELPDAVEPDPEYIV